MKTVRITFQGRVYELGVEVLDSPSGAMTAPPVANTTPVAPSQVTPPPAPAPAAPAPAAPASPAPTGGTLVASPMAGIVLSIGVKPGDRIEEGQELMILEAMKMQAPVFAPCSGTIGAVMVSPGAAVVEREPMIQIL